MIRKLKVVIQVVMKPETKEYMRKVLSSGNKIFLDKLCKNEELRHAFYQTTDDDGVHFYHVRLQYGESQFTAKMKDYDCVDVPLKDKSAQIEKVLTDIQNNYVGNGYLISCDKLEE